MKIYSTYNYEYKNIKVRDWLLGEMGYAFPPSQIVFTSNKKYIIFWHDKFVMFFIQILPRFLVENNWSVK